MNNFVRSTFLFYLVSFILVSLLNYLEVISQTFFLSALYAGAINISNTFLAAILYNRSYKSNHTIFMIFNFGGLGIRLFFLLISFILVIKFLNIDKYGFIFIFFIFYFVSLIIEVIFYSTSSEKNK
ncbi:MAG: hypothetical protein V3V16_08995 [Melioribacteraceae bacterium]